MSSELIRTLRHLSQAAILVDSDNRTNKLLHCYYLSRLQTLAAADHVTVEQSSHSSCTKCTTSFNDSKNFSLSIRPRKIRKGKYKRLATKPQCGSHDNSRLVKLKRNYGKRYQRLVYNVAEFTCNLCHSSNKSSIRFDTKDKDKSKAKSIDPPIAAQLSQLELARPKKRKRDKSAGLIIKDTRIGAVNPVPAKAVVQPSKSLLPPAKAVVQPSKSVLPPAKAVVQPSKSVLPPGKSKTNKNSKNSKNFSVDRKKKDVSSAQKQRKGILLLANVLKMNDQRQEDGNRMKLNKMFK